MREREKQERERGKERNASHPVDTFHKEIRLMGTLVIQPCLGSQKKIEKMLNEKKKEKTPAFNEFAPRVLNFQRRANWMSNVHIRADWVSNIQFSPVKCGFFGQFG